MDYVETFADTRFKLASTIGYAARKMWRRKDLEDIDNIILDLLCEALQRIGHSYRPREGEGALQALAKAPSHIKELVSSLENIAKPGRKGVVLKSRGTVVGCVCPYIYIYIYRNR